MDDLRNSNSHVFRRGFKRVCDALTVRGAAQTGANLLQITCNTETGGSGGCQACRRAQHTADPERITGFIP